MNIQEVLTKIDSLLRDSKLDEAREYMNSSLKLAYDEDDYNSALTILNEQCGFYRDLGQMKNAIECCEESEKLFESLGIGNTKERAAAYINTANVYRTFGELEEAFAYFKKAGSVLELCGDESLYSSYYNNLSLLHQEAGRFEDATECLKKALYIADEKMHDEIRTAISRTNLATSLLRLKRIDEAEEYLKPAIDTFKGRTPSDFHYSAALSAMGDLKLFKGEFEESTKYFEMALSEIELHMGQNNFYDIVTDNLANAYRMLAKSTKLGKTDSYGRPLIKGLELCRRYYKAFGEPVIKTKFEYLLDHIAVGMAGQGSECLGFDDGISKDHDFGPGFCIWVDDTVSDKDIDSLKKFYELLPKTFMGVTRLETAKGVGRVGVIKLTDFLKQATGFDHLPKGVQEWQYTVDENLVLLVNGEIFIDRGIIIEGLRKYIRSEQPYYVYFRKLSIQLENMAKHGQYSYERALKRNDFVAASVARNEFIKAAMRAVHIICKKYAPYVKWLRKSLDTCKGFETISEMIDELVLLPIISEKENVAIIEKICEIVRKGLEDRSLITTKESYLAVAAGEVLELANRTLVADEIVNIEWERFDKTENEGGRASCQDDWTTFSIMRRSQYYTWPMEMLQMLYADYSDACSKGRNVITEKYGYMMEYTVPEEFKAIKDGLPPVSDEKKAVINAIADIQVGWMEEFAKEYPLLAGNARAIHSSEDTPFMTSYETYLKGELSTYNDDTLKLYGQYIATLANSGKNLAKMIMNKTIFFYGYESLDKAEKKEGN